MFENAVKSDKSRICRRGYISRRLPSFFPGFFLSITSLTKLQSNFQPDEGRPNEEGPNQFAPEEGAEALYSGKQSTDRHFTDTIPGDPGSDYPAHRSIPKTAFSCKGKTNWGYYADIETDCQVGSVSIVPDKPSANILFLLLLLYTLEGSLGVKINAYFILKYAYLFFKVYSFNFIHLILNILKYSPQNIGKYIIFRFFTSAKTTTRRCLSSAQQEASSIRNI